MSSRHSEQYTLIPGLKTRDIYGSRVLQQPYLVRTTEVYDGASNPKWKTVIASHQNATNHLEASKSFVTCKPVSISGYYQSVDSKWYPGGLDGWYGGLVGEVTSVPHLGDAFNKARTEFLMNLQTLLTSDFKGMTFLGELRETANMLKTGSLRLLTSMSTYAKRAKRLLRSEHKSRKSLKKVTDLYLEGIFGWIPLIHDVESLTSLLLKQRMNSFTVDGFGSAKKSTDRTFTTGAFVGRDIVWVDVSRTSTTAKIKGVYVCDLPGQPVDRGPAERLGLSLREFLPTVWELVPYSFVADYFFHVGDVLNSSFVETKNLAWVSSTQRTLWTKVVQSTSHIQGSGFPSKVSEFSRGELRQGVKHLTRGIPNLDVDINYAFSLHYPQLGSLRYLNMAALLLQTLRL